MVQRSLNKWKSTRTRALGKPAKNPLKVTQGKLNFYLSGSQVRLMYFFMVQTVPNCRATCGPTPNKFMSIPLQKDRTPSSAIVFLIACKQPVYQSGLETTFSLIFSKGIMVRTWPMPDNHPQNISLATSPILTNLNLYTSLQSSLADDIIIQMLKSREQEGKQTILALGGQISDNMLIKQKGGNLLNQHHQVFIPKFAIIFHMEPQPPQNIKPDMFTLQYRGFQSLTVMTRSKIRGKDLDFERDFSYLVKKLPEVANNQSQKILKFYFDQAYQASQLRRMEKNEAQSVQALSPNRPARFIKELHRLKCRICQKYFSDYYRHINIKKPCRGQPYIQRLLRKFIENSDFYYARVKKIKANRKISRKQEKTY